MVAAKPTSPAVTHEKRPKTPGLFPRDLPMTPRARKNATEGGSAASAQLEVAGGQPFLHWIAKMIFPSGWLPPPTIMMPLFSIL